jgi:hypothetical protein
LYRSLQVLVAPADTVHAESFAHTHGRLAIVPALKASANRRVEKLRIERYLHASNVPPAAAQKSSKFKEADAIEPAICHC